MQEYLSQRTSPNQVQSPLVSHGAILFSPFVTLEEKRKLAAAQHLQIEKYHLAQGRPVYTVDYSTGDVRGATAPVSLRSLIETLSDGRDEVQAQDGSSVYLEQYRSGVLVATQSSMRQASGVARDLTRLISGLKPKLVHQLSPVLLNAPSWFQDMAFDYERKRMSWNSDLCFGNFDAGTRVHLFPPPSQHRSPLR